MELHRLDPFQEAVKALQACTPVETPSRDPKLGQPAQLWPYWHADGELAGYVARWDKLDGGKAINLPELRERSDDPVLVVKGEKTSDAVRDLLPSSSPITSMGEGAAPERLEAPEGP